VGPKAEKVDSYRSVRASMAFLQVPEYSGAPRWKILENVLGESCLVGLALLHC
jgi:hypothetical protein